MFNPHKRMKASVVELQKLKPSRPQGRYFIFGALGYLNLGSPLEGLRRLMSYKSALWNTCLLLLHSLNQLCQFPYILLYSEFPWYQEPEPCKPPFISPNWT